MRSERSTAGQEVLVVYDEDDYPLVTVIRPDRKSVENWVKSLPGQNMWMTFFGERTLLHAVRHPEKGGGQVQAVKRSGHVRTIHVTLTYSFSILSHNLQHKDDKDWWQDRGYTTAIAETDLLL